VTGASILFAELGPKQLGLLRELVPTAGRIGLLINPCNVNAEDLTKGLTAASQTERRHPPEVFDS
jgi:ABC-type uncharacterized transport system substrate-binding protein